MTIIDETKPNTPERERRVQDQLAEIRDGLCAAEDYRIETIRNTVDGVVTRFDVDIRAVTPLPAADADNTEGK